MESTALGVRDLFNSIQVDNLIVNDTFSAKNISIDGTSTVEASVVTTSLEPASDMTVDIGSATHRFKRAYLDDLDVGDGRAFKYLKTDADGIVNYVDLDVPDVVTLGTANGLSLDGQELSLALATTASAGAMSATDKTTLDTLNTNLLGTTVNLGVSTSPVVNTINIGTGTGPTTLNLGGVGDTVNVSGTLVTVNATNTQITDPVLTLNKNGVNANSVGVEILGADPAVAAEVKTDGTGTVLQVRGVTGVNQVEIGGILNVDQSAHTVQINHNANAAASDLIIKNANTGNAAGSVLDLKVHNDSATITKYGAAHSTNSNLLSIVNGSGTLNMNTSGVTTGTCDLITKKHDAVTLGTANGLSLSGQQLSLATATTSTPGAIAAVDQEKLTHVGSSSSLGTQTTSIDGLVEVKTGGSIQQVQVGRVGGVFSCDIFSAGSSSTPLRIYDGSSAALLTIPNNGITTGTCDLVTSKHAPVTLGTANGLSLSGQQLSLATATQSVAGAMSASDKYKLDQSVFYGGRRMSLNTSFNYSTPFTFARIPLTIQNLYWGIIDYNYSLNEFFPTVGGHYRVSAGAQITSTSGLFYVYIYLNENPWTFLGILNMAPNNVDYCSASDVLYCNGTSDYLTLRVYGSVAGTVQAGPAITWMSVTPV